MKNREIAKIFYRLADYLDMENMPFKPYAYQKAALVLQSLEQDISQIYAKGGLKALENIPGIGQSIARKIEEYLISGRIKYYEEFKKKLPLDLEEILSIEGMGPKKAKLLFQKLGLSTLKDLEEAARNHKIASLPGFGQKSEKNILQGIAFLKKSQGRFLLGDILPYVKEIVEKLKKIKEVEKISPAGSVRRRKETIGDVDILLTAKNAEKVMDFFVKLPGTEKVWMKGPTKSSLRTEQGFDLDLRVVKNKSYGSALQYFTGSKAHNIALRRLAIDRGLKLSEYGLFKGKRLIAGWNEAGIYKALGLDWIEPELRENQGEIEAALKQARGRPGGLPCLISYQDIKGDLHCHSDWDGGENSIKEMAESAQKMGYHYIGIADHTKFLKIERGLDEGQLALRNRQIDRLNRAYDNFRILKSAETNILSNGLIDIKNQALAKLDYVIAGVHSSFKMNKKEMTNRIIRAMKNPYVNIISHPTGRILKRRDEYEIDFDMILRAARQYNVCLEINAYPKRLDLNDRAIYFCRQQGVKMAINSDAHRKEQLSFMEFGLMQARRGWAEKKNIVNSWPLKKLLAYFKND